MQSRRFFYALGARFAPVAFALAFSQAWADSSVTKGSCVFDFASLDLDRMRVQKQIFEAFDQWPSWRNVLTHPDRTALPKHHELAMTIGAGTRRENIEYRIVERRPVLATKDIPEHESNPVNLTGLSAGIAIIEDGQLKKVFLEGGRYIEPRFTLEQARHNLKNQTGVSVEAVEAKALEYLGNVVESGALNIEGRATVTRAKTSNYNVLKITKLDENSWVVRLRAAFGVNLNGAIVPAYDRGDMFMALTAIVSKDGTVSILPEHGIGLVRAQLLHMSSLQETSRILDPQNYRSRPGFHIAAIHDHTDGLSAATFGTYRPARFRVTIGTSMLNAKGEPIPGSIEFTQAFYYSENGVGILTRDERKTNRPKAKPLSP